MKALMFMLGVAVCTMACTPKNATQQNDEAVADSSSVVSAKVNVIDSLKMQSDLGDLMTRTYEDTIPAADCPGIIYSVTLYNQQYSGDGVFMSKMTYIEAEDGKNMTFDSYGRWGTLRGDATDQNATVYELREFGSSNPSYLLYLGDSLEMLDADMARITNGLNYTLRKK